MVDKFGGQTMNSMTYKGYFAKINFDDRDNIFWGKVIGVKDSITFEGETVTELKEDFHNAIDHYLTICEQENVTPDKPYSGKLTLRLPPQTHAEIAQAAAQKGTSLNKWVTDTLTQAVTTSA